MIKFESLLLSSALVRILLICYGDWQDKHMEVRYTDVDYIVFSDAAASMASGASPYARSTYRYSPLLAFLLLPNAFLHLSWGKLLFSASDLLVAYLIRSILRLHRVSDNVCTRSIISWLFNPFTFTIGTRGNCEPVSCALVLLVILCLLKRKVILAAIWYGLAVHFRIYPIIYALPIVLFLHFQRDGYTFRFSLNPRTGSDVINAVRGVISCMLRSDSMTFGIVSTLVFFTCTGLSLLLYGQKFLQETLLYHLTRTDPRHNFSIYFYCIYINCDRGFSIAEKLFSFLPQMAVQLVLILCFARDLPFCFFMQTIAFVAFNKVMTAQYFVWFFCLLPLILPWSTMKLKWEAVMCIIIWTGAQAHWLMWAYILEFRGENVFVPLWVASMLFLAANTFVMVMIVLRQSTAYAPCARNST